MKFTQDDLMHISDRVQNIGTMFSLDDEPRLACAGHLLRVAAVLLYAQQPVPTDWRERLAVALTVGPPSPTPRPTAGVDEQADSATAG